MKKHIFASKRRMLSLFILAILACEIVISPVASAAGSLVTAHQDDVFNKLEEAAKLNVITNNLIKCFNAGGVYNYVDYGTSALSGSNAADGKVFYKPGSTGITNTDHTTSLWLEDEIQNNGGDNGTIWCWQGQSEGKGLFQLFAKAIGKSAKEILCKDGKGRIYQRAKSEIVYDSIYYTYAEDKNCSSMNDTGAVYIQKSDWKTGLQEVYDAYVTESGNPYLPAWSEIGSFDNVDGYFNYLMDFEKKCGYDVYDTEPSDTTVYPITRYDKSTNKIVAKKRYIHVSDNKSGWTALSADNPVTSCTGFLERIEALRGGSNGVVHSINDADDTRGAGYEGIILAKLREECNGLKDEEGNNAWESMKTKLQEIIDSEDASDTLKQEAQDSLEKITNANGNYVEESGSESDPEGKIYQCLDIAQMNLIFDEYEYGAQDFGAATKEPSCFDNTGALGWVLCPLTEQGGKMVISFYNNLIEPFLMIDVGVFSGTHTTTMTGEHANNGLYSVWQFFQFLANLAFVGLFIFIIISQITGFGIDNYGIKKVLPKLIMGAILINASYVICQLSVEVANILGVGIKNLFSGIDVGLTEIEMSGVDNASVSLGSGVATGAGLVLVVAIITLLIKNAVLALDKVVVAILMMIIIVMISVLFLFVVLSLRYALTILLVVVSPLAFACYMLPNTKKIFNQWFNLFKGLLLAYPISAAMVFGGQFVGEILIAANATGQGAPMVLLFSAAIMSIAPVFLIPSTIKKSMGAIGGLVDRVQGRAKGFAGHQRGGLERSMERSRLGQWQQAKNQYRDHENTMSKVRSAEARLRDRKARAAKGETNIFGRKIKMSAQQEERLQDLQARIADDKNRTARRSKQASDDKIADYGRMFKEHSMDSIISGDGIEGFDGGFDNFDNFVDATTGEVDVEKIAAALQSMPKSHKRAEAFKKIKDNQRFIEAMAASADSREMIAQAMSANGGDLYGGAVAKQLRTGGSAQEIADQLSDKKISEKVGRFAASKMAGADSDMFKIDGIGDSLTDEQFRAGFGSGYSGSDAEDFNNLVSSLGATRRQAIASSMNVDNMSGMTLESMNALTGQSIQVDAQTGQVQISDEQREMLRAKFSAQTLEELSGASGNVARAKMDPRVLQALGISASATVSPSQPQPNQNGGQVNIPHQNPQTNDPMNLPPQS